MEHHAYYTSRQPGYEATRETDCARCPYPIKIGQRYIPRGESWIHAGCASGADDE